MPITFYVCRDFGKLYFGFFITIFLGKMVWMG